MAITFLILCNSTEEDRFSPECLVPIPESWRDRPDRGAGNGELAVLAPEIASDIHVIVHLINDARVNAGKHHRVIGSMPLAFGWPSLLRYRSVHDVTTDSKNICLWIRQRCPL